MAKRKIEIEGDIAGKLFIDISVLIDQGRRQVASVVNSAITMLYWEIGKVIKEQILQDQRGEYGERIILTLSQKLTERYGRGWSKGQLWNCLRTAETIRTQKKINELSRELSWTHIRTLVSIKRLKWIFIPLSAEMKNGIPEHWMSASTACCSNVRPYRKNRQNS
jgi:hypothetical protein